MSYAWAPFVIGTLASTASHRAFVTIAIRPSCRVRRAIFAADLPCKGSGIFLICGLDMISDYPKRFARRVDLPQAEGKIALAREATQPRRRSPRRDGRPALWQLPHHRAEKESSREDQ